jgi:hypothetical protein
MDDYTIELRVYELYKANRMSVFVYSYVGGMYHGQYKNLFEASLPLNLDLFKYMKQHGNVLHCQPNYYIWSVEFNTEESIKFILDWVESLKLLDQMSKEQSWIQN